MNLKDLWRESTTNDDDMPNIVRLELPRDHRDNGAAWIYVPHKDTIYIGPPGSYHVDISASLRNLIDVPKSDKGKLLTGVLYDDGYSDIFEPTADKNLEGRILRALQMYHDNNYDKSFNDAEDDAGAWGDNERYVYPRDVDDVEWDTDDDLFDEDDNPRDPRADSGRDTVTPALFDHWYKDDKDDYKVMKPSPGAPKPISQWGVQDYLDWRDKKYWGGGGSWAPREDYPHFRWSYGDSRIFPGCPHEGLWVWPTQNGYPDHFSQTGQNGLGCCSQGRIYAHQGDRWEILTWPDRPRRAPDHIRDILQDEAAQAVKKYVMEKMGVPEDKIFFTKMGYGQAVSWYDSPSYPQNDVYTQYYNTPAKNYTYDWEPLADWNAIPEGAWNKLRDPEGVEWNKSGLKPEHPGFIRLYNTDSAMKIQEIDPNTSTAGWEIGKRREVSDDEVDEPTQEMPAVQHVNLDQYQSPTVRVDQAGQLPIDTSLTNSTIVGPGNKANWHTNADGSISRIINDKTLMTWRDGKFRYKELTPEEVYETKVNWFQEDQDRLKQQTNTGRSPSQDAYLRKWHPDLFADGDQSSEQVVSMIDPASHKLINVSPEEYELAYRLHGDNWWKSFIPNENYQQVS